MKKRLCCLFLTFLLISSFSPHYSFAEEEPLEILPEQLEESSVPDFEESYSVNTEEEVNSDHPDADPAESEDTGIPAQSVAEAESEENASGNIKEEESDAPIQTEENSASSVSDVSDPQDTEDPKEPEVPDVADDFSDTITCTEFTDDSDSLFAAYANQIFYPCDSGSAMGGLSYPALMSSEDSGQYLTGQDRAIYNYLKAAIEEIAAGNRTDTIITIPVSAVLEKMTYTAEELGLESISKSNTSQVYSLIFDFSAKRIVNALLADCPYEFYWYNKTVGTAYKIPGYKIYGSGTYLKYTGEEFLQFSFTVSTEYAGSENYTTNPDKTAVAVRAADRAKVIVEAASGLSDYGKLHYYLEQICELTSYDSSAVSSSANYGNPWQLIYVFDGDETTNVVCEGYAKAFQYLCECTCFESSDVFSILVSGSIPSGGHMWNVVHMDDGGRYLVDITNCDAHSNLERLFLVPATSGSVSQGYVINTGTNTISYRYDATAKSTFTEEDLTLSSSEYHSYTGFVTDPTCTGQGYTVHTCQICSDSYTDSYMDPLGHDYQLSDIVNPTLTEQGYSKYCCSRCDDVQLRDYLSLVADVTVTIKDPVPGTALSTEANAAGPGYEVVSVNWTNDSGSPCSEPALCGTSYTLSITVSPTSGFTFLVTEEVSCTVKSDSVEYFSEALTAEDNGLLIISFPYFLPHDLICTPATEPTFSADGNCEFYTCSYCGKIFADSEGKKELSSEQTVIPAKSMITPILQDAVCGGDGIVIRWSESASCASYTDNYSIYRKIAGGNWSKIAVADAVSVTQGYDESGNAICSYTDTAELRSGATYVYTVRASGEGNISSYNRSGVSAVYVAAPILNSISNSSSGIVIRWSSVANASRYAVYRKTSEEGKWSLLSNTITGTSYTDTSASGNTIYSYTVRAFSSSWGCYDATGFSILRLPTPSLSKINNSGSSVKISWNSVPGADQYYIYRKPQGGSWQLLGVTMETVYSDSSAVSGSTYTYTVRARNSEQEVLSSYNSGGLTIKCLYQPVLTSVACSNGGLAIKWTSISGASQYRLYRKTDSSGWSRIASLSSTSYIDTSISSGIVYYYTVIAADGSYVSSYNSSGVSGSYLAAPTVTTAIENTASRIHIKWSSVGGADSYILYRKSGSGSWSRIADGLTATEYYDTGLSSGISYNYTVRAFNSTNNLLSGYKTNTTAILFLAAPAMTVSGSSSVTVSWQKVAGATSYALYRRSGENNWSRIASVTSSSYKDTTVTPGIYYYYTVRAINGNTLGCYDQTGVKAILPATVSPATATVNDKGIQLSWVGVTGGDTYQVWRKTGSSGWCKIATIDGLEYSDANVVSGTSYTYTIRAYNTASNCLGGFDKTGVTIKY